METKRKNKGFTIVELLTVMSVIALLIGLLVPALNMVRRIAKDTRQRAQFHSISAALETYAGDMEQYPDSNTLGGTSGGPYTTGAHHLAEALVGRDMLGLDPWTTWSDMGDETNQDIYASSYPPKNSSPDKVTKSLDRRKGPYLNPETVEAYQIAQLYADTSANGASVYPGNLTYNGSSVSGRSPSPVLTDSYRVRTITMPNKGQVRAGTPILYYKANVTSREFYDSNNGTQTVTDAQAAASIFNSMDNEQLLMLGTIMDQNKKHNFDKDYPTTGVGRGKFYDAITNPKITTQLRPYNQTSYILISAGFDGIFGTPDDIYNFSQ